MAVVNSIRDAVRSLSMKHWARHMTRQSKKHFMGAVDGAALGQKRDLGMPLGGGIAKRRDP
jgi:hypothetical protein